MSKILTSDQVRAADAYTIKNEPIASIDLMERASKACYNKIISIYPNQQTFHLFCGIGNNGGDGLAIARMLHQVGKTVFVHVIRFSENESPDFTSNYKILQGLGVQINEIKDNVDINLQEGIIIDAILGSGVTREAEGLIGHTIYELNNNENDIVAIDFPSGLYHSENNNSNRSKAINATHTLTFQVYKLAFLLPENKKNVGQLHLLDIGLNESFIDSLQTPFEIIDKNQIQSWIHKRNDFSHKGSFGHALLVEGSYGKMGAATLSANACLRSGVGLLSVLVPQCGYEIMQTSVPEAMVHTGDGEKFLAGTIDVESYTAVGVGPGLDTHEETYKSLLHIFKTAKKPVVIDADGLNLVSKYSELRNSIPKSSILTPHPKEFDRLFGEHDSTLSRIHTAKSEAKKMDVYVLLKGRYTAVACPDGKVYFNTTGNPGMATGGSGDVLTGIVTGMLAQGYSSKESMLIGVYLHGLAGDYAAKAKGIESMIASDITSHIKEAYADLH